MCKVAVRCIQQGHLVTSLVSVNYQADPSQYRYRKLEFDGSVAILTLDVDKYACLRPGCKLKLNSYHRVLTLS